jgi:hypothetical protein
MRVKLLKLGTLILAFFLPFLVLRAQELQCDTTIKKVLQETADRCKELGRNKGCYGNTLVLATPKDGVSGFTFDKPSDTANIADISSLRLAAFKPDASEWGVSYLRVQANFPDTQPGQYVTMLLFGDTVLEDRSRQVADQTNTEQKPMQAVYFRSGTATLACKRAPTSGLILQTPKGAAKAELTMNEVKLSVGSTVFIESPDDNLPALGSASPTSTPAARPTNNPKKNKLVVTTIEGEAQITANGVTRTIRAGQKAEVQLTDNNSRPVSPPSAPVNASIDVTNLIDVFIDDSVEESLLDPTPTLDVTATPSAVVRRVTFTPVRTITPGSTATFVTSTPAPTIPTNTPGSPPPSNTPLPTVPTSTPFITSTFPPTSTPFPTTPPPPTSTPIPTNTLTNRPSDTPTPIPT